MSGVLFIHDFVSHSTSPHSFLGGKHTQMKNDHIIIVLDLEWKVLYVGSAQDASRDQVLDEILVGPVPVGVNKFVLQADAPDPTKLAQEDLLGVTVVLVTCSYKEREFVRVGYYVNNEYHDPDAPPATNNTTTIGADGTTTTNSMEEEEEKPITLPNPIPLERIQRQILADKPRVTKFPISWGDEDTTMESEMGVPPSSAAAAPGLYSHSMQSHPMGHNNHNNSDLVSMQEESNMGGLQAMAE
jgi:histone chaperone ASF1